MAEKKDGGNRTYFSNLIRETGFSYRAELQQVEDGVSPARRLHSRDTGSDGGG